MLFPQKVGHQYNFNVIMGGGYNEAFVEAASHGDLTTPYTSRLTDYHYDGASYRKAIIAYYKACGCKVISWKRVKNTDLVDITHTLPTKGIDPTHWYRDVYAPRIILQNRLFYSLLVIIIALILSYKLFD